MNKKELAIVVAGVLAATSAQAFQFSVTDDIKGSLDSQATVGFGLRTQNPYPSMVGDTSYSPSANTAQWSNGDDGNLNYRKGDLFALYTKLTPELLMEFPSQIKLMARGTLLYDYQATDTARTSLSSDARDQVARDYRLLDLWVSKSFNIGDNTARIRVGNQVISWGESIFALGGINSTNAMDLQKLMIPGTQLKEAILPAQAISFATGLGKGLNLEAYYQWDWNRNRVPPVGTYFSIADIYDKGRRPLFLNPNNTNFGGPDTGNSSIQVPPAGDKTPSSQGQFGVSLHYKPEGTPVDFGFYFLNYHDKMPVLEYSNGNGYQWNFLENRQLYGVSANFPVGNWAVGWELSYRPKEAVALSACGQKLSDGSIDSNPFDQTGCKGWKDTDKYQSHLTGILQLSPADHGWFLHLIGADSGVITGELVGIYFPHLKDAYANGTTQNGVTMYQVPAAGYMPWLTNTSDPNSSVSQTIPAVGTKFSTGYTADFNVTYDGTVIPGWQITPGFTFFQAVIGDTPTMLFNYAHGAMSLNNYLLFNQNPTKWQVGLNFTMYFDGADANGGGMGHLRQPLADRDFIGGFVTYNF